MELRKPFRPVLLCAGQRRNSSRRGSDGRHRHHSRRQRPAATPKPALAFPFPPSPPSQAQPNPRLSVHHGRLRRHRSLEGQPLSDPSCTLPPPPLCGPSHCRRLVRQAQAREAGGMFSAAGGAWAPPRLLVGLRGTAIFSGGLCRSWWPGPVRMAIVISMPGAAGSMLRRCWRGVGAPRHGLAMGALSRRPQRPSGSREGPQQAFFPWAPLGSILLWSVGEPRTSA